MTAADNRIIIINSLSDSFRNLRKGEGGSSKTLFEPNSSNLKFCDSIPSSREVFSLSMIPFVPPSKSRFSIKDILLCSSV